MYAHLYIYRTYQYNFRMELSVSEARQRLPELVRRVREDPELRIQITVHGNLVAELRASDNEPPAGAAAQKLLELIADMPEHEGPKRNIAGRVKEVLYGGDRHGPDDP